MSDNIETEVKVVTLITQSEWATVATSYAIQILTGVGGSSPTSDV